MLYTGGTTGMPKGVLWRHDDLFARLNNGGFRKFDEETRPRTSPNEFVERDRASLSYPPVP
jgi:long-subunit acyl-CoA synthetase (AMP-forming)